MSSDITPAQRESIEGPANVFRRRKAHRALQRRRCGARRLPEGRSRGPDAGGFNLDGEFYVTDDLCTHGPGSLSEGYIDGDVVECNFHNGQFNIRTGEVVLPPCMVPIKTYPTVVEDGKVFIEA